MTTRTLYFILGPTGSGKSTIINRLAEETNTDILVLDDGGNLRAVAKDHHCEPSQIDPYLKKQYLEFIKEKVSSNEQFNYASIGTHADKIRSFFSLNQLIENVKKKYNLPNPDNLTISIHCVICPTLICGIQGILRSKDEKKDFPYLTTSINRANKFMKAMVLEAILDKNINITFENNIFGSGNKDETGNTITLEDKTINYDIQKFDKLKDAIDEFNKVQDINNLNEIFKELDNVNNSLRELNEKLFNETFKGLRKEISRKISKFSKRSLLNACNIFSIKKEELINKSLKKKKLTNGGYKKKRKKKTRKRKKK